MANETFTNTGQPHGALFNDVPTYHVKDAAILRAAYGPAAVPADGDDYTWTEEAAPLEPIVERPTTGPELLHKELELHKAAIRKLQRDVQHLQTIVHRLLNPGCDS